MQVAKLFPLLLTLVSIACVNSPTVLTHGVPNLVKVEANLWRAGQPTTLEQWQYLKSLGITQVVKLNFETEGSDKGAESVGMKVHVLSIQPEGDLDLLDNITHTLVHPDATRLDEAEQVIESGGGVLVHCTHGQDRTGLVVGRYRVLHDGWTKDAAYAEMRKNNFHQALKGLHEAWENFQPPVQKHALWRSLFVREGVASREQYHLNDERLFWDFEGRASLQHREDACDPFVLHAMLH